MTLSLGTLLAGRYEITAPIAVGGMGEVWRARDRVLDRTEPEVLSEATSADVAAGLTEMMISVVQNGPGRAAQIDGGQVAGKTGTAENAGPDHNWFVGFAPADDPEIAVAVFVANGGGTGGDVSAPIARDVIAAYLERGR